MNRVYILISRLAGLNASVASLSATNKNKRSRMKTTGTYQGVDSPGRMEQLSALWT